MSFAFFVSSSLPCDLSKNIAATTIAIMVKSIDQPRIVLMIDAIPCSSVMSGSPATAAGFPVPPGLTVSASSRGMHFPSMQINPESFGHLPFVHA